MDRAGGWQPLASLSPLQLPLRPSQYRVLHFAGHGAYDGDTQIFITIRGMNCLMEQRHRFRLVRYGRAGQASQG